MPLIRSSRSSTNTFNRRLQSCKGQLFRVSKIILVTFVVLLGLLFNQKALLIKSISCQTNTGTCSESTVSTLSTYLGKSVLFLDRAKLRSSLSIPVEPEDISIHVELPGKLAISLRYPAFRIPVNLSQMKSIPDDIKISPSIGALSKLSLQAGSTPKVLFLNGQMIDSSEVSRVTIYSREDIGVSAFTSYAKAIKALTHASVNFTSIHFYDNTLVLSPDGSQTTIMNLEKPLEEQILALQHILSTATIKESQFIDLRFNRPIIK